MLVFPDADVERSVEGAIAGMRFTRQGQSCTAASRIYVHRSQIGRASRRERVCQYVSISVVDGSLNKKYRAEQRDGDRRDTHKQQSMTQNRTRTRAKTNKK